MGYNWDLSHKLYPSTVDISRANDMLKSRGTPFALTYLKPSSMWTQENTMKRFNFPITV